MRRILPVAAAFVALAALTAWREAQRPAVVGVAESVGLVQIARAPFTADRVVTIDVSGPGDAGYTLTNEASGWSVDRPFAASVPAGPVNDLIAALAQAQGELRSEDVGAHERFHVSDDTAVRVKVTTQDGQAPVNLLLGRSSGRAGAFVRAPGRDAVYAVTADLRGLLGLPRTRSGAADPVPPNASHFHDITLPAYDVAGATRMVFETPDRRAVFERADGTWHIAGGAPPLPVLLDGLKRVRAYVATGQRTLGLVDPRPAAVPALAEAPYRTEITFPSASGTPRTIAFVGARSERDGAERFYARLDGRLEIPTVYEVSGFAFARLFPPGDELLEMDAAKVQVLGGGLGRIDVQHPERAFVLSRELDGARVPWRIESPVLPLAEDKASVEKIAVVLRSTKPVDWVDGTEPGPPALTLRFGPADATRDALRVLTIHGPAPSGRHLMARMPDLPGQVMVVNQSMLDGLTPRPFDLYRTRLLTRLPRIDVRRVTIERGDVRYEVARGEDSQSWTVSTAGSERPADRDAVVAWLERLLPIQAASLLDGQFEPELRVEILRRDGTTVALEMAAQDEDGYRPVRKQGIWFRARVDDPAPDPATLEAGE